MTTPPQPTPRQPTPRPTRSASRDDHATAAYPAAVLDLIDQLARLPGIGRRSAERLAFHILTTPAEQALPLADAVRAVKREVRHCPICFNLAALGADGDAAPCRICADERRDRACVLVVEQPRDLIAIERTGEHRGLYHVLMGHLDPLDGVGPESLTIDALLARADDPARNAGAVPLREIILALNPTLEGDGTALHLRQQLAANARRRRITLTRLSRGLASGTELDQANHAVLADALADRRPIA